MQEQMRAYLARAVNIPESEWQFILPFLTYRSLEKNEHFIRAGEVAGEVAYIYQGLLRMYCVTQDGEEFNKLFKFENDLIGGLRSLISGRPSLLSIEALEKSELLVLPYAIILQMYQRHSCWQELGRKIAEKEFLVKEKREDEFLFQSAAERYQEFKKDYPGLIERIPQYQLAGYLGVTPQALNRLLKGRKNEQA